MNHEKRKPNTKQPQIPDEIIFKGFEYFFVLENS